MPCPFQAPSDYSEWEEGKIVIVIVHPDSGRWKTGGDDLNTCLYLTLSCLKGAGMGASEAPPKRSVAWRV